MRIQPAKVKKPSKKPRCRPLYWNFIGDAREEKTTYYFLITNTNKRQIEDISGIIYGQLKSPIEARQIDGKIQDLHYRILIADTHNKRVELYRLKRAYNGELKKDINLYEGKRPDRLENYVINKLEKMLDITI